MWENLLSSLNLFIQILSIFPQNQTAPGLWEIAIHIPRWASQLAPTSMKFPNFNSGSESWIWRLNYSTVIQSKIFTGWGIAITCQMHPHPGTDYMHYWPQLNHENNKASPGQESSWQNLVSLEGADPNQACFRGAFSAPWVPDEAPAGSGWSLSVQDPSGNGRSHTAGCLETRTNTETNFCWNWSSARAKGALPSTGAGPELWGLQQNSGLYVASCCLGQSWTLNAFAYTCRQGALENLPPANWLPGQK